MARHASRIRLMVELAGRDYVHDWPTTLFTAIGLVAVLAPLLVLLGLKVGTVGALTQRLVEDPVSRQLRIFGQGQFGDEFLAALQARPETGFVVPATRFLAATAALTHPSGAAAEAELLPTAPGDPLILPGQVVPAALDEVALSDSLATKLGAEIGTGLEFTITRRDGARVEVARTFLRVVTRILPRLAGEDAALLPLPLMKAAEDWRSGYAVDSLGWPGKQHPTATSRYASFRLFAKTIEDVQPLRDWLIAKDLNVVTRLDEIDMLRSVDRSLTWLFAVVAALAGGGFMVSLAVALAAAIRRRRRELATLLLLGFGGAEVALLPLVQAALTALIGFTLSSALFALVAQMINYLFATAFAGGQLPCRLPAGDLAWAAGLTLIVAFSAASLSGFQAARIDPSRGLREE